MPPRKNIKLEKRKIILAEGVDALYFFINLLGLLQNENIQVLDFGGINDLTQYLNNLTKIDGYDKIESILIARDSETSSQSSSQSINSSLRNVHLIDETLEPFNIQAAKIKIGFVLFPGYCANKCLYEQGTLEDLCIKIFEEQKIITDINSYLDDFQKTHNVKFKSIHKNQLHMLFSFTDKYVGLKLGEVMKAGGFNLNSPSLKPFVDIIQML
ncbi:MAG: hypothetical protein LBP59_01230 [Planctomycetaceae bacterium]|jgi:hypothetical protein|nr:hypothetical protein [Planctomycetaceae bacterium]